MLFNSHVPTSYWVDAFSSAVFIINRLPTKQLDNRSPYELLYSRIPQYGNFKTYGCLVYPYLRDYSGHKLAPRSFPCVFIGYQTQYKGYKCLDPVTSRVYITRHARFNEVAYPIKGSLPHTDLSFLELSSFLDDRPTVATSSGLVSKPTNARSTFALNEPVQPTPCQLCDSTSGAPATMLHLNSPSAEDPSPTSDSPSNTTDDDNLSSHQPLPQTTYTLLHRHLII